MIRMNKGIQLAIFTALISGVSIFVNKFAADSIKPALTFTATKNVLVALAIVTLLIATRKWRHILKLKKDELIKLGLIATIGGSLPFYLFFTGLTQTSAINAAIIQKTLVLWVALLAIPFLKEKISMLGILAVALLFGSNIMVGGFKGFTYSTGELMILAATLLWAVENVIAKKVLTTVDPDIVTGARMGFGSMILYTASLIVNPKTVSSLNTLTQTQWMWLIITAIALFSYVSIWYRALKLAPATTVAAILVASTLVTNILSATFVTHTWKEDFTKQGFLMLLGVALLVWQARRSQDQLEIASQQ